MIINSLLNSKNIKDNNKKMIKQFYTYLGDELCNIKNGPFRKLG